MEIVTRLLLKTNQFDANLKGAKKSVNSFTSELSSITSKALPGIAAFTGISLAVGDAVRTTMEFEKSLSSLKALTGVSTQELSFFKEEAIRLGSTTTQTAAQIVDAYKLIGSQMPELLKNKEALSRVTEQAIVLAEAAELDVPTAAKALTGSLNQMGESSMHASEYINILAAASQQGSADIPYLNKAIEGAGGTASAVGVKFNQLVAAVEAIAPKITDAGSAGTNLRNIFLTLESSADKNLKPSVVGLSAALENLSAKKLDATQMTKMFGKESVTAALALVKEKDTYIELEKSITDTNTAYEQQRTNNDNLAGSIKGIQSAWEGFILTINQSNGMLKDTVDILTKAINGARRLALTREQLNNLNYSDESKTVVIESSSRIEKSVDSGMTMNQALDKEIQTAGSMYPEAIAYQTRLNNLKKKEAEFDNARFFGIQYAKEEAKAVSEARHLFELSEREYKMRQAIYDNVEAQRKEMQAIADAAKEKEGVTTGEGDTAALKKAQKEAEERRKAIFKKNEIKWSTEGWAKQEALGGTQFKQPLEQPLKITPLPITIDEIADEALPKTDLEIKLKAKLENYEFAKKKIEELKALSEVATTPEEKKQIKGQIGEWEKFGGVIGSRDIDINNEFADSLQGIGSVMQSLSGITNESAGAWLSWGANTLSAVSQAIPAIIKLTTANTAKAASEAASSAAQIPFVGWLAAGGAALSVVAAMASIPKCANGGIAYGNSLVNVGEYAGASGNPEVIAPLSKLREYIQPKENAPTLGGEVNFVIKGTNLVGVINNHNKRQNKI